MDRQPIKIVLPFLYQEDFDAHKKEMWTYENPTISRNLILIRFIYTHNLLQIEKVCPITST